MKILRFKSFAGGDKPRPYKTDLTKPLHHSIFYYEYVITTSSTNIPVPYSARVT